MFGLDLHSWETVMLVSLALAALVAGAVGVATTAVVMLQRSEVRAAAEELAQYKVDAGVKIAQALSAAAKAHERAAELERQAAELKREAELAKESAALANKQILEMKRMRRLEKPQADALRPLLTSDWFQSKPQVALRVAAVADAEAEMFAMELMKFFESCGVNVYPTNGGHPNGCTQLEPSANGLVMTVKSLAVTAANQPFTRLQVLMHAVGLPVGVEEDPNRREGEAMLSVLRKPT